MVKAALYGITIPISLPLTMVNVAFAPFVQAPLHTWDYRSPKFHYPFVLFSSIPHYPYISTGVYPLNVFHVPEEAWVSPKQRQLFNTFVPFSSQAHSKCQLKIIQQ